jgi:hypothetical protein
MLELLHMILAAVAMPQDPFTRLADQADRLLLADQLTER